MFFQLKVVVTDLDDKLPHLIFVAKRSMEVGEELLYDYNDRLAPQLPEPVPSLHVSINFFIDKPVYSYS